MLWSRLEGLTGQPICNCLNYKAIAQETSNDHSTLRRQFQNACELRVALGRHEFAFLGANGSGKSNVLETIRLVRDFVCEGNDATKSFPGSSLCRWDMRKLQTFEIDLRGDEETYRYRLEIEHEAERERCRVKAEQLAHNGRPIFASDADGAQVYEDDGVVGTKFLIDGNRSGVGLMGDSANTFLAQFKRHLKMLWSLHINPDRMVAESETENDCPTSDVFELRGMVSPSYARPADSGFRVDGSFEERGA